MISNAPQLTLYYFATCPFCLKVLLYLKLHKLSVALKNIHESQDYFIELQAGGGKTQVPCLRIVAPDESENWLYESNQIIAYLAEQRT